MSTDRAAGEPITPGPARVPGTEAAPAGAIVDGLFRRTAGQLVARIARRLGSGRLELAEDAVQHALLQALRQWPFHGVPAVPAAWLARTAWNRALDLLRAEGRADRLASLLASPADDAPDPAPQDSGPIDDDELRLLFACCHPGIPLESAVALALRTLCGFGIAEVARAFLAEVPRMQQRIVRAKRQIARERLAFELPEGGALVARRDRVLRTLYLLFNEGYAPSAGEQLLRPTLCAEAIRLCDACAAHPLLGSPEVDALLALMLLQASRFDARLAADGSLVPLQHQDRVRWSRPLVARGHRLLDRAGRGTVVSRYHLQAGSAGLHASAPAWDATDWAGVCAFYELLLPLEDTPVLRLNRAIALGERDGPARGVDELAECMRMRALRAHPALHGASGEFQHRLGQHGLAAEAFARAAAHARTLPERSHFEARRALCEAAQGGTAQASATQQPA